jgi:hypothetical protein
MQLAFRPSIWLKLAMFVGVLVVLMSGVLIWTAYLFTRDMVVDQIHTRLTVVASDRQAMLLAYIHQQHERVRLAASPTRLRRLLEERADDKITDAAYPLDGDNRGKLRLRPDRSVVLHGATDKCPGLFGTGC